MSTKRCFSQSSVGQSCSAIVDRLTRGEYICEYELFDDVSCVSDVVEQLFDLLGFDNDMQTFNELCTLISCIDHHRSVREEDHDDSNDDHRDHDNDHDGKDDDDDENDHDEDHHDGDNYHDEDNNLLDFTLLLQLIIKT